MCTYYFHVRDANGFVKDEDGIDLPDVTSALKEALQSARQCRAEGDFVLTSPSFEIADDTGRTVLVIPIPEPGRLS